MCYFVLCKLDYRNSLIAGWPQYLKGTQLQSNYQVDQTIFIYRAVVPQTNVKHIFLALKVSNRTCLNPRYVKVQNHNTMHRQKRKKSDFTIPRGKHRWCSSNFFKFCDLQWSLQVIILDFLVNSHKSKPPVGTFAVRTDLIVYMDAAAHMIVGHIRGRKF